MVVLITGASRGIGRATALKFAQNKYDIALNYYSDDIKANETKNEIEKYGVKCVLYKCDISNEDEVKKMIDSIWNDFGRIDSLVNNAGIANDTLPFEKNIDDFKRVLDVNLIGTYLVSKYVSKHMNKGSIVNVASTNALNQYYPYSLDYDASKAGVISLTHNLATTLSPNVRVNAVCPGWVNTDMNKELDDDYIKEECENIMLRRFAEPNEIANVICFLASDDASYINNSVIRIDGGTNGSC
ncbi:MAG: SDR family oxidoreductase [Bacilli bacterium]|nr:SDR family oxidoreductase [Bacilli bacterium]